MKNNNYKNNFLVQFLQLAGQFWNSENKATVRTLTLGLFVLTIMQVIVAVVITEWSANLFNSLEQRSMSKLLTQISLIVLIFLGNIAVTTTHFKIKRHLQLSWRNWLTDELIKKWMYKGRHYQVTHIQGEHHHDNPDGRIAEDIRIATESAIDLCHSLIFCLMLLMSFTKILWTLSGTITLDLGLFEIPLHGHLVWIALIYAATASVLGWWIGQPLTKATDARQTVEANFRFGLVNARENSLAIALVHGEENEQERFQNLFQHIVHAWQIQTQAWANILMFTSGYSVLSMAFPILVSAPRYIWGTITLGSLMQSAQAFQQMASALSWPVDNMAKVAEWRASVERVLGLAHALEQLEEEIVKLDPYRIEFKKSATSTIKFHNLSIMRLDKQVCVDGLTTEIKAGDHVRITGNAFTGSKLFKVIAGLWPWGCGSIELPEEEVFFMPPRPYLPVGKLRDAICYPTKNGSIDSAELEEALKIVKLHELLPILNDVDNWVAALSREQQQRLGVVRLLLKQPKWILIQEAFDSLDSECELAMLRLIEEKCPNSTLLTISNEPRVAEFHQREIFV